jgi:carbon storage regulator
MLVLSRKSGEQIRIGRNITVTVQRIAGNRVSLAIEAPQSMRILRGELPHETSAPESRADAESSEGDNARKPPKPGRYSPDADCAELRFPQTRRLRCAVMS